MYELYYLAAGLTNAYKGKHWVLLSTAGLLVAISLFMGALIMSSALSLSNAAFADPPNGGLLKKNVSGGIISPFKGNVSAAIVNNITDDTSSFASNDQPYAGGTADEESSLTVNSDKRLYKPGEEVNVDGSISSGPTKIGGDNSSVKLDVTDDNGNKILANDEVKVDSDGVFSTTFTLPQNASRGSYSVNAAIEAGASIPDTLGVDAKSKLESSARFEVLRPTAFAVKVEGKEFDVNVASNSTSVREFAFNQEEKTLSFKVEGQTGTRGVAQVTLPKELLSGRIVVSFDGRPVDENSNDVIVTSKTATETIIEINYPHSEHTIKIAGTMVVPEFPPAIIASVLTAIGATAVLGRTRFFSHHS
jgi:hypothetical protein